MIIFTLFSDALESLSIVREALDTDGTRTFFILMMMVIIISLIVYTIRHNN